MKHDMQVPVGSQIPKRLQPFLPSSPVENLETERDYLYIIESLLKHTDIFGWKWMLANYSQKEIAQVIKESKTLKRRDVAAMVLYLNLPESEVLCTQIKSQGQQKNSWHY